MRKPHAYLRKSVEQPGPRSLSWEMQERAVRDMAGDPALVIMSDWGRSGGSTARRPEYRRLLSLIEAGEVSVLYAYSLSRLSRSLADFSSLVELCQAHDVPIRLHSERHLDFGTASGRLMVNILASFAQMERELASERARDAVATRKARGDRIGPPGFGQPDLVVAAYREAGSFMGAARLLTAADVPTRAGRSVWRTSAVAAIVRRHAPSEAPVGSRKGSKKANPFYLAGLLVCHCGHPMTASRNPVSHRSRNYSPIVYYRCHRGLHDPMHGPRNVNEKHVLPWVREEMDRLRPPVDAVRKADEAGEKANALRERKARLARAFVDGLVDEDAYRTELAGIEGDIAALESIALPLAVPAAIDWENPVTVVNDVLRHWIRSVQLGPDLRPLHADWYVPEWRRPDGEAQAAPAAGRA